jgi:hypothetical protein
MTGEHNRQDMQSWVNILLSRKKHEGMVLRSRHRELPVPGGSRKHSSYRWWITEKGVKYLSPAPTPEITPLPEPPTARRVLELLAKAGDEGITGPMIGRHFTLDYDSYLKLDHSDNLQRRLNWSNQILHRFLAKGFVERGNQEASPWYHNMPAYRWYITDKGREYLDGGMAAGERVRRQAAARAEQERRAARRTRADQLVTQAYVDYDPSTVPSCVRTRVIRELREAGCTLDAIGGVFSLTRERVRQILKGISVNPCRCPKHGIDYSGLGWPT